MNTENWKLGSIMFALDGRTDGSIVGRETTHCMILLPANVRYERVQYAKMPGGHVVMNESRESDFESIHSIACAL